MTGDIFGQTITRLRAGQRTTRGGDIVTDWSPDAVQALTIPRVSVQPSFQREETDAQGIARITGYRVLTAPGQTPDITALDRIVYGGQTFAVDGEIALWPDPHGADHIELLMVTYRGT